MGALGLSRGSSGRTKNQSVPEQSPITNKHMNKKIVIAGLVAGGIAIGFFLLPRFFGEPKVGFDSSGAGGLPTNAKEYDQIASLSDQGLIKSGAGRLFSVEVANYDAVGEKFFQIFDMSSPEVPSRAASLSNFWVYKASTSWASAGQITAKPITSWYRHASASLRFSIPVPSGTSSTSPGILRLDSSMFGPAWGFSRQLIWGMSSAFQTYSSSSVETSKIRVRAHYE